VQVRRALGVAALTRGAVFVLSFATVVVVSRLLTPEEIGIFSVSVAIIGLAHVFRDFGVGQYLIQVKEVTREKRRAAFTVTLMFSWTLAMLLVMLHPLAGSFYANVGVAHVMLLLAVNFLILPFGSPLRTLLQREMQFGKLAVVNLTNHVVQSGTTVAAAWAGASYMSMAWGSIAGNAANVIVLLVISPKGALDWPTHRGLREVLTFGSKASVAALAGSAGSAAPDLVLGRTLGFADVAFYSRAKGLVAMALDQLMYVVRSVYAPAFAKGFREGKDPALLYAHTAGLLLGLTVPMIALLGLLSPYLISGLFGPQWARSAPLGMMFCGFALLTAPFTLAATSLVATGHVGVMMRARLAIEGARILVLLSSLQLALESVVALLGLASLVEGFLYMRALRSTTGLSVFALWASVWRSYALLVPTLLGPALVVIAVNTHYPLSDVWVLLLSSALALLGWGCGLHLLSHPLKVEAIAGTASLAHRVRAMAERGKR
jgi:O-antigen/teichoic acid export membrane protein